MVRPGELNLMTAGAGSPLRGVHPGAAVLHGVQLWVALPDSDRVPAPSSRTPRQSRVHSGGATLRVFLGELAGARSPVRTFTPLVGAQLDVPGGCELSLDVDPSSSTACCSIRATSR